MKKSYNEMTTNDMPVDSSFMPKVERPAVSKTPTKPKITARGSGGTAKDKATTSSGKTRAKVKPIKLQDEVVDLEQMNDENIKSYRFKSRRNRVVIITLVVLLLIAIASISIYLVVSKLETNCEFYAHGAEASFIIDGDELTKFRAPSNLQGNARLEAEIELRIEEAGLYNIKFIAKCYQKGVLLENTLIYDKSDLFFEGALVYDETDQYHYSKQPISGNQTIRLCGGVIFDYQYRDSLNINNFKMEFHVYLTKL